MFIEVGTMVNWQLGGLCRGSNGGVILGGNQVRCVGVDEAGEVVKARGEKCDRLDQMVTIDEDGVHGSVEFGHEYGV